MLLRIHVREIYFFCNHIKLDKSLSCICVFMTKKRSFFLKTVCPLYDEQEERKWRSFLYRILH